ncbi:MAG TPA: alpha-L-rhamnosidase C-terminal domain-containing protein, partial [Fimbriimonas sp.]|nr:alpha-L-rhamnosidase C-terminal domain-containing protein [Fimbriimonas sp.]
QRLGGIAPAKDAAGFDKIEIHPCVPKGLDWVKSSFKSIRGKIVSNWSRQGDKVRFEIEVPPNTIANVTLPGQKPQQVGSGRHQFESKID